MWACTEATMGAYKLKMPGTFVLLDREFRAVGSHAECAKRWSPIRCGRSGEFMLSRFPFGDRGRMCSLRPARQSGGRSAASLKLSLEQHARERGSRVPSKDKLWTSTSNLTSLS